MALAAAGTHLDAVLGERVDNLVQFCRVRLGNPQHLQQMAPSVSVRSSIRQSTDAAVLVPWGAAACRGLGLARTSSQGLPRRPAWICRCCCPKNAGAEAVPAAGKFWCTACSSGSLRLDTRPRTAMAEERTVQRRAPGPDVCRECGLRDKVRVRWCRDSLFLRQASLKVPGTQQGTNRLALFLGHRVEPAEPAQRCAWGQKACIHLDQRFIM